MIDDLDDFVICANCGTKINRRNAHYMPNGYLYCSPCQHLHLTQQKVDTQPPIADLNVYSTETMYLLAALDPEHRAQLQIHEFPDDGAAITAAETLSAIGKCETYACRLEPLCRCIPDSA